MAVENSSVSNKTQLKKILEDLRRRAPEALSAVIATRDGFSVASGVPHLSNREEDTVAVAAARILGVAHDIGQQLEQGDLGGILIEGKRRSTVVMGAGRDTALVVVIPAEAHIGRAMMAVRQAARKIEELYG